MAEIDQQIIIERIRNTSSYEKLRAIETNITKRVSGFTHADHITSMAAAVSVWIKGICV